MCAGRQLRLDVQRNDRVATVTIVERGRISCGKVSKTLWLASPCFFASNVPYMCVFCLLALAVACSYIRHRCFCGGRRQATSGLIIGNRHSFCEVYNTTRTQLSLDVSS